MNFKRLRISLVLGFAIERLLIFFNLLTSPIRLVGSDLIGGWFGVKSPETGLMVAD